MSSPPSSLGLVTALGLGNLVDAGQRFAVGSHALQPVDGDVGAAHLRPAKLTPTAPSRLAAAIAAFLHMRGRSRVVATGSGGNP